VFSPKIKLLGVYGYIGMGFAVRAKGIRGKHKNGQHDFFGECGDGYTI
jgi:hypothetical protein